MAGYNDNETDEIAAFSQYVDDYFDHSSFRTTCPPSFSTPICKPIDPSNPGISEVYPVQTGIQTSHSISEDHQIINISVANFPSAFPEGTTLDIDVEVEMGGLTNVLETQKAWCNVRQLNAEEVNTLKSIPIIH